MIIWDKLSKGKYPQALSFSTHAFTEHIQYVESFFHVMGKFPPIGFVVFCKHMRTIQVSPHFHYTDVSSSFVQTEHLHRVLNDKTGITLKKGKEAVIS